jgi:hypothetical protein
VPYLSLYEEHEELAGCHSQKKTREINRSEKLKLIHGIGAQQSLGYTQQDRVTWTIRQVCETGPLPYP